MLLSKVTVYSAAVCKLPHQMRAGEKNSDRIVFLQYSAGCKDGETKACYSEELHSQGASRNMLTSQTVSNLLKLPVYN